MTAKEAQKVADDALERLDHVCGACGNSLRYNFGYGEFDHSQIVRVKVFCPRCQSTYFETVTSECINGSTTVDG